MPFEEVPGGFRRVGSYESRFFSMIEFSIGSEYSKDSNSQSEPPNISAPNFLAISFVKAALQQYAPHLTWEWSACVDLVSSKSSFWGYQNQELQQAEKDQGKSRGFYASLEVVFNERNCTFEVFKQKQFIGFANNSDDLVLMLATPSSSGDPQSG